MRHSIDGYKFATEKGYYLLARICITHSFPYKNKELEKLSTKSTLVKYLGNWICWYHK